MSNPINDGGPAFPVTGFAYLDNGEPCVIAPHPGMTLRDWLAGQALAGLLFTTANNGDIVTYAEDAYTLADAMLTAREVNP